jgi:predicted alpha/beta superfamily hydrolase
MKTPRPFVVTVLVLFAAGWLRAEAPAAAPVYPPHVVPGTELRVLPRTRDDRLYQLHIALPASFRDHPEKKYPVVFVTDGYWDFTTVVASVGNMVYGKNLPEMIVVGLGYAGEHPDYDRLRRDDLLPMVENGTGGGAAEFLGMIQTVVIPLLEKEYRADPAHRYLMGCSLGGGFSLYAMLTKPALFQGYVADSPAVSSLWNFEQACVAAGRTTDARVYLAVAENEPKVFRQLAVDFYRRLQVDGIVKGGLAFRENKNLRHAGGKPVTYTQGLRFVTTPIAPESGVSTDWLSDPADRPGFLVNFRPKMPAGALPPAAEAALQEHGALLVRWLTEKRIASEELSPPGTDLTYSNLTVFAVDPAAVEALVRSDPAVQAGVLTYDIVPAVD